MSYVFNIKLKEHKILVEMISKFKDNVFEEQMY
jgi:hypothetical protein